MDRNVEMFMNIEKTLVQASNSCTKLCVFPCSGKGFAGVLVSLSCDPLKSFIMDFCRNITHFPPSPTHHNPMLSLGKFRAVSLVCCGSA